MNAANTNACPAGSSKITTEATCAAAAAFLGRTYGGFSSSPLFPSGCYLDNTAAPGAFVRLNVDPTGAAASVAQPLCLGTGAPPATAASRTPTGYAVGGVYRGGAPRSFRGNVSTGCTSTEYCAEYPGSNVCVPRKYQMRSPEYCV